MKKAFRDTLRMAREEGVDNPWVEGGDPHARLFGYVNSRLIKVVFSATKHDAPRWNKAGRLNVQRAVRRAREESRA